MKTSKILLTLVAGLLMLYANPSNARTVKSNPPPNWVFFYIDENYDVWHWDSDANCYVLVDPPRKQRIILYPNAQ